MENQNIMLNLIFILTASIAAALGCLPAKQSGAVGVSGGRVREIGQMNSGRAAHAATLLTDGRVLITGGFRTGVSSFYG